MKKIINLLRYMDMTEYETITFECVNQVATIGLNRPNAMNAINQKMRSELLSALDLIENDPDIKVGVFCGNGKGFSAGGDLLEGFAGHSSVEEKIVSEYIPIFERIQTLSKLLIARIHGPCTGIAAGVVLASDLAVMGEKSFLYFPFANLNLVPDGGVSYHLVQHFGYKKSLEIYVNGGKVSPEECLSSGLINKIEPEAELIETTQAWAEQLAKGMPLAHKLGKQCLQYAQQNSLTDVVRFEAKQQVTCSQDPTTIAAIKSLFSKEKLAAAGHK